MNRLNDGNLTERLENRLTEMIFENDINVFNNWFKLMVKKSEFDSDNVITFINHQGQSGGFDFNSDPVTKAAMIGFAISGIYWTKAFPGLLKKVNQKWKKG
jgi:hypothetical protein